MLLLPSAEAGHRSVVSCFLNLDNTTINDQIIFLTSLQKTRHPAAGGNTTYRLTVKGKCRGMLLLDTSR
jgi:hypothetical protein